MALNKELDYRLRWLDFDRHGHIRPTTVLDLLQDVATIQAEEMGIGRDDMLARGVFWAVVRLKYEVIKEPVHYQVVRVRTWPHTPTSFSFMRDFSIRDEAGDLLIKASSEWVLMDIESRKFVKVTDHYTGSQDFDEERSFQGRLRKIADFGEDTLPTYEVVPTLSDIDVNGHVNNARYPSFVMDALETCSYASVRSMQIDYRHEALPGEPLVIHAHVEDSHVSAKGVRADGAIAFACSIEMSEALSS